jgi:hypothetical protein
MKRALTHQARRAGFGLAAVVTYAALGIGSAQAQEFAAASITLENAGEAAGSLNCSFRETDLIPFGYVRYDCSSQYVGVLQQCMLKNRPVGNSQLLIFQDIHPADVEVFDVKGNGSIRETVITQIPESESNALICTAPSELTVTAIRWCDNTLTDLTNGVPGTTVPELYDQLVRNGTGSVPSCENLANGPFTTPGE